MKNSLTIIEYLAWLVFVVVSTAIVGIHTTNELFPLKITFNFVTTETLDFTIFSVVLILAILLWFSLKIITPRYFPHLKNEVTWSFIILILLYAYVVIIFRHIGVMLSYGMSYAILITSIIGLYWIKSTLNNEYHE